MFLHVLVVFMFFMLARHGCVLGAYVALMLAPFAFMVAFFAHMVVCALRSWRTWSRRNSKMLYLVATIGVDADEKEPPKESCAVARSPSARRPLARV